MGHLQSSWCLWYWYWIIPVLTVVGRSIGHDSSVVDEKNSEGLELKISQVRRISLGGPENGFRFERFDDHIPSSFILLQGQGFDSGFSFGLTLSSQLPGTVCSPDDVLDLEAPYKRILEQGVLDTAYVHEHIGLLARKTYYACTKMSGGANWIHQGPDLTLETSTDSTNRLFDRVPYASHLEGAQNSKRMGRSSDIPVPEIELIGMTFDHDSDKKRIDYDENGTATILENMEVNIRFFGRFTNDTFFKFSKFHNCDDPSNNEKPVRVTTDSSGTTGEVTIRIPPVGELNEIFLCLKTSNMSHFIRQGESVLEGEHPIKPWLMIKNYKPMLPLYLHIIFLVILLGLSGLFSGLNLGLMSLNKTDLSIIINTGTPNERKFAKEISPVRKHGNFLLCCLLFSNVLVNASLTILVDELTTGLIAIVMSTMCIVIFGEIIPQAICSRHGLAVGACTILITKFFMLITFPLAYPLSKILDKILGEEIGSVYTRERLKELLKVTKDHHGLQTDEVGIISGALDMKTKTVENIMTRLDSVFMLPIEAVLNFDTMAEVEYHGYSRIPVYEGKRSKVVALLNVKQLTLLDANDNIPLKTVVQYYHHEPYTVFENTPLDFMFNKFREGSNGHMAVVKSVNDDGTGDPTYETIGVVTMEDVLEEVLGADIMDESDIGKHDARQVNSNSARPKHSIVPFHVSKKQDKPPVDIPPPLALAAVQFLSTSVEPFTREYLSVSILKRLIAINAQAIKLPKYRSRGNQEMPEIFLFEVGKPAEYFVLILEGRVEVSVGQEKLTYESGAFTTFGKDFLMTEYAADKAASRESKKAEQKAVVIPPVVTASTDLPKLKPKIRPAFVPDYTVKVVSDIYYMRLKYSAYKAGILATGIERANADPLQSQSKNWQDKIEEILEHGDDDTICESGRKISKSMEDVSRATSPVLIKDEIDGAAGDLPVPDEQTKLL